MAWQWVVQVDGHTPRGAPVGMPGQVAGDARVSLAAGRAGRAAMARTTALARVRGQLLRMLDADDLLTPGALARDINILAARPDIGVDRVRRSGPAPGWNPDQTVPRSAPGRCDRARRAAAQLPRPAVGASRRGGRHRTTGRGGGSWLTVSSPAGEDTDAADAAAVTVRAAQQTVFTVHATLANEVRPTEAVFSGSQAACEHAEASSTDPGVLAASVVRFTVNELGTRRGVAMFVHGRRQEVPHVSDCRGIYAGGRQQ